MPNSPSPQLSNAEATFYDYCTELANWLGPHHDHIRPPASQVLAKASQLTELKTGHPLKGYDPTANGALNGSSKKEGEAPPVLDAPALTFEFFDRTWAVYSPHGRY
jgi:N-terminal acetyltransferase B complex non-catalytic subunit